MKEIKENQKSGKGWNEDADPTCINKKGKSVARRHHDVAAREEFQNTLRTPLFAPLKPRDKEDEEFTDEIIDEVQEKLKSDVISRDSFRTAERVDDQDEPEEPEEPEESDLEDEDDKSKKPKKDEDEDEEV